MEILPEEIIAAAKGEHPSDIVLKNATIVDVFNLLIFEGDVAIYKNAIVGVDRGYKGRKEIDIRGKFLVPGLFDAHVHPESTMVDFTQTFLHMLRHGTTTVIVDAHEIANVLGLDGIRYVLQTANNLPMNIFLMLPSNVPPSPLETSGATLSAYHLRLFLRDPHVLGLGEVSDYRGVLNKDHSLLTKLNMTRHMIIDGHAPNLVGKELNAYIMAGIRTDHEFHSKDEAREKLRKGLSLIMRFGVGGKNFDYIRDLLTDSNSLHLMLGSSDLNLEFLMNEGHVNKALQELVQEGIDPLVAIRCATLSPAVNYNIKRRGAIAPGFYADLVVFNDLKNFEPILVIANGIIVAKNRELSFSPTFIRPAYRSTMNPPLEISFDCSVLGSRANVILLTSNSLYTKWIKEEVSFTEKVVSDIDRDLLKTAVIGRHTRQGIAIGLIKGFGLKKGAIASSFSHDAHNIVVTGADDFSMKVACDTVIKLDGGIAIANGPKVLAYLDLPFGGILSFDDSKKVREKIREINKTLKMLGSTREDPLTDLTFLTLTSVPELKISDKGLVDVNNRKIVGLFEVS
ncbi:MAG: adenine deaminase [Candidatus Korarchaeota archaeon]